MRSSRRRVRREAIFIIVRTFLDDTNWLRLLLERPRAFNACLGIVASHMVAISTLTLAHEPRILLIFNWLE